MGHFKFTKAEPKRILQAAMFRLLANMKIVSCKEKTIKRSIFSVLFIAQVKINHQILLDTYHTP